MRTTSHPNQEKALEAARQNRDSAMHRLENMTSTTTTGDDADADANANSSSADDHSDESIELGRRISATPQHGRLTNLSGLDLDDDMFADLNTTLDTDTVGPASAQRSNETSTLSTSHFRRRPRAGSFLSRDDGPLRPSSRTGPNTPGISSTFNIGVFKRRAREPSILGTAQKQRPQRPEPEEELESTEEEEEEEEEAAGEDGFAPEAESTPFKHSKRRSGAAAVAAVEPQPQEAPAGASSDANANANPRKRKSEEGHAQRQRSSPYSSRQSGGPIESIEQQSDSELSELASREPSLPPLARDQIIPTTPIRQEDDEEVLAPPLSSGSSEDDQEIWPPLRALAKGVRHKRAASAVLRRTPVPNDGTSSDMSSPPSLTYSPNYPETSPPPTTKQTTRKIHSRRKAAAAAPAKPPPKITTADLAGMLPRRRRRQPRRAGGDEDPFGPDGDSDAEVDASGLANDEDELYHLDVRARRRRGGTQPATTSSTNINRGRRAASKPAPATTTASSGSKAAAATTTTTRRRRTYGRSSDKENQNDEDDEGEEDGDDTLEPEGDVDADLDIDDSRALVARVGAELKDAKRKFQEVDKWALEYEEMTQSSSPRGAR